MTTLYRSPNIMLDGHQWFVAVVRNKEKRPRVEYKFRRDFRQMWKLKARWPGPIPKGFNSAFRPFCAHIDLAIASADFERGGSLPRVREARVTVRRLDLIAPQTRA